MNAPPFERGTDGPKVIVVGVDGSPTSIRARAYAIGLARRQRSRLIVAHVAPLATVGQLMPGAAAAMHEAVVQVEQDLRAQVRDIIEQTGVAVELRVERGDPYIELSRIATETLADMVVVGASARLGHRVVGSVAVRLVKAGRWPVVVVP